MSKKEEKYRITNYEHRMTKEGCPHIDFDIRHSTFDIRYSSFYERAVKGILVLLAVVFVLVPAGCKKSELEKPKVALIMKSLANEFFKTMEEGARAHAKEHAEAYDLVVVGIKDEQDAAKQIDYVETMMAQKVDAIVIAPADSKALVPVCKRAMDAGITVVNIERQDTTADTPII